MKAKKKAKKTAAIIESELQELEGAGDAAVSAAELNYRVATVFWKLRRDREQTQKDVAQAAGIKRQALTLLESGQRVSSMAMLQRVSHALGVPLWQVIKDAMELDSSEIRPKLRKRLDLSDEEE